jgi:hypothetical protein
MKTGTDVSRRTRSVVDPKNILRMPLRPCELITISSAYDSDASRRISVAGFPVLILNATLFGPVA